MWDLPRPGVELVSSALAGGFLTTAPPGTSQVFPFLKGILILSVVQAKSLGVILDSPLSVTLHF